MPGADLHAGRVAATAGGEFRPPCIRPALSGPALTFRFVGSVISELQWIVERHRTTANQVRASKSVGKAAIFRALAMPIAAVLVIVRRCGKSRGRE